MLFVSYASQDRAAIDDLLAALRRSGQQVWFDDELSGGEAWWNLILQNIRGAQVFVVALSGNSLMSKPCQAELAYAKAVRRPILPVQIGPVDSLRVTPFAATQIVDYRHPTPDAEHRLISALRHQQERASDLPTLLPEEPAIPFAYLMRMAKILEAPELGHSQQAEALTELRHRLDEDYRDPNVRADIIRLMYRLRDRPDVTWRTRADVDALLAAYDANLSTHGADLSTTRFPGSGSGMAVLPAALQPSSPPRIARPGPGAVPAPTADPPAKHRGGMRRRLLIAAGAGSLVIGGAAVVALVDHRAGPAAVPLLLADGEIAAIMGASDMATQEGGAEAKPSNLVDVSPPDCVSVLYPGMDQVYRGSGHQQLTWAVLEPAGGLGRAGVGGNRFVDQDVAVFAPGTDHPVSFVRAVADRWQGCAGKVVTVNYPDHNSYRWTVADVVGEAPNIIQTYALVGSETYTCQRILDAVSDVVIDVKACGVNLTDEAQRIVDKIAATAAHAPSF